MAAFDWEKPTVQMLGRWQPWHDGHQELFKRIHAITGQYTIFIKILCKDTPHFREILDSKIHKVKGITRTESFMSIEETLKDGLSLN